MDTSSEKEVAATLPLLPRPINWSVIRVDRPGQAETFMARDWWKEDAERCRLCPTCTARLGRDGKTAMCSHRVSGLVSDEEIEFYRFRASIPRANDECSGSGVA